MGDDTKFYDRVGLRENIVLQYCRFFFGLHLTLELESKAHALQVLRTHNDYQENLQQRLLYINIIIKGKKY